MSPEEQPDAQEPGDRDPPGTGTVRRIAGGLFPAGTTVWTAVLVVINAAIYLGTVQRAGAGVMGGPKALALLGDGGASAYTVIAGEQWWRVITYQFLHAGLWHIGFNMYALLILGPLAERLYGRGRFLFLYLFSGAVAGAMATGVRYAWYLHAGGIQSLIEPTVGASGALLGLMGAILASTYKPQTRTNPALRRVVFQWLFWVFVAGWFLHADNLAHLGGLLGGAAVGMALAEVYRPRRIPESAWLGVSAVLVGLVAVCFWLALHRAPPFPIGVAH